MTMCRSVAADDEQPGVVRPTRDRGLGRPGTRLDPAVGRSGGDAQRPALGNAASTAIGAQPTGERLLPAGQALSISAAASGPVMADVTPEGSDTRVELLEQSGGRSRILWWRGDLVLFGF